MLRESVNHIMYLQILPSVLSFGEPIRLLNNLFYRDVETHAKTIKTKEKPYEAQDTRLI